jgi:hypothetical protein
MDPSLQASLILLTRGVVSSDDISVSLDALGVSSDSAIFSFPLSEPVAVSALPRLAAAPVPRMCTPWDGSSRYLTAMSMSSSVDIAFGSSNLAA